MSHEMVGVFSETGPVHLLGHNDLTLCGKDMRQPRGYIEYADALRISALPRCKKCEKVKNDNTH